MSKIGNLWNYKVFCFILAQSTNFLYLRHALLFFEGLSHLQPFSVTICTWWIINYYICTVTFSLKTHLRSLNYLVTLDLCLLWTNIVSIHCFVQKGKQKLWYINSLCDLSQMGPTVLSLQSVTRGQQPHFTTPKNMLQRHGLTAYVYEDVSLAMQVFFLNRSYTLLDFPQHLRDYSQQSQAVNSNKSIYTPLKSKCMPYVRLKLHIIQ